MLFDKGQLAPGNGWIARARRLLDEHQYDAVERGYLLLPNALERHGRRLSPSAISNRPRR